MLLRLLDRVRALALNAGEVQLWLFGPRHLARLAGQGLASGGERWPGAAATPGRRLTRELLRRLLAAYAGLDPARLRLERGPHGKPRLAPGLAGPRFSVSSSEGWLLAAFAHEELGVDLERERDDLDQDAVARRCFSEAEWAWWQAQQGGTQRRRAFLKIWTRKEALLKLRGVGLAGLDTLRDPGPVPGAWLEDLRLPPSLVGTLAMDRAPCSLRLRGPDGDGPSD